jgi:hypothetical protein
VLWRGLTKKGNDKTGAYILDNTPHWGVGENSSLCNLGKNMKRRREKGGKCKRKRKKGERN